MREIDRLAVEEFGLSILQMMENAGRILALHAMEMLGLAAGGVAVLAGSGGNGGGGLGCARHLTNRGVTVTIVLNRNAAALTGAVASQMTTLAASGIRPAHRDHAAEILSRSDLAIDALIGYGLRGPARGTAAELIAACNRHARRVLALDVPSGLDSTTGEAPGQAVRADRIVTLALPKTGLHRVGGDLYLADIGIPSEVHRRLGLPYIPPFGQAESVRLQASDETVPPDPE